ncbi:MAG: hypothetical protein ACREFY_20995, partial [Acetobacteraceae bacterium]
LTPIGGNWGLAPWPCPLALPTSPPGRSRSGMIARGDLLWLGIAAGLAGGLVGGVLLGIGIALILNGAVLGWVLLVVSVPLSAAPGGLLALRLTQQLPPG